MMREDEVSAYRDLTEHPWVRKNQTWIDKMIFEEAEEIRDQPLKFPYHHFHQSRGHKISDPVCGRFVSPIQCSSALKFEKKNYPSWCGSVDWVPAWKPTGCWLDSQSGHRTELQARFPVGGTREATTHCCFFHPLPPSHPLCLKINK